MMTSPFSCFKFSLALLCLTTILYNEFYVYYCAYSKWNIYAHDAESLITILLVADPQIQGNEMESSFPLESVSLWDSDRYLSKGFQWVLYGIKPDAILFLGDLVEEGSITEDDTVYEEYVTRFYNIYRTEDESIQKIYLPGDNDIGGEWEIVSFEKVGRFLRYFSEDPNSTKSVYRVGNNIEIYTVDESKSKKVPDKVSNDSNAIRIVASHLSILLDPSSFNEKLLQSIEPSLIFSAHSHKGTTYTGTILNERTRIESGVFKFFEQQIERPRQWNLFPRNKTIFREVSVPSCSYRVGEPEMAFGLLRINEATGEAHYDNLWLPSRFDALYLYIFISAVVIALLILSKKRFSKYFSLHK